ncbi:MAG: F0F1 ATP synthase subunit B [Candidatus Dormibacteria bacterium]
MLAEAGLLDINGTFMIEVVAFIAMLLVLAKYAYPPIVRAAEARQKQIEDTLKEAERARAEVGSALEKAQGQIDEAKEQAREVVSRAQQEAKAQAEEFREKGRHEAEAVLERARGEIAAERDRAIRDLRAETGALAIEAASRILGQAIDARAHQRLIDETLEKVSPGGNGRSDTG